MAEANALKSVSTMLIEEVAALSYANGTKRITMRSLTEEEIRDCWQLPPGSVRLEIVCTGERARWYEEHLGEYVTMEVRRRE